SDESMSDFWNVGIKMPIPIANYREGTIFYKSIPESALEIFETNNNNKSQQNIIMMKMKKLTKKMMRKVMTLMLLVVSFFCPQRFDADVGGGGDDVGVVSNQRTQAQ
ncbi:unnamed protein product, partial [Ceratitis capitata]